MKFLEGGSAAVANSFHRLGDQSTKLARFDLSLDLKALAVKVFPPEANAMRSFNKLHRPPKEVVDEEHLFVEDLDFERNVTHVRRSKFGKTRTAVSRVLCKRSSVLRNFKEVKLPSIVKDCEPPKRIVKLTDLGTYAFGPVRNFAFRG